ncbi:MAG: hypothetical protein ACRDTG_10400, partial [Pseudonocardiaceae bacterium]
TGRVTYARNIYDGTLDRSYDYDEVGRLKNAYTGAEAKAHVSLPGSAWGTMDGPYAHEYRYDQWGNIVNRWGRGGENNTYTASYAGNKRVGMGYDLAGNLTNDGVQTFTYDATGQQASASSNGLGMS